MEGFLTIGCHGSVKLRVFPGADLAGCSDSARSTSGMWMEVVDSSGLSFPLEWASKLQTVVSHSTPEAELVAMSRALREYALPMQSLWAVLLGREVLLDVMEDNQSTIEIISKGFSSKLSHLPRTHKISLAWTAEAVADEFVNLLYCPSLEQKGDMFTKVLDRVKHAEALKQLGIRCEGDRVFGPTSKQPVNVQQALIAIMLS